MRPAPLALAVGLAAAPALAVAPLAPQEYQSLAESAPGDAHGDAVAVDGDLFVVGNANANEAYVYRWAGASWTLEAVLADPEANPGDDFGASVAVHNGTIIIGAPADEIPDQPIFNSPGTASVYIHDGLGWTREALLFSPTPENSAQAGIAVDIHGDTAVLGAHLEDGPIGANEGAVVVFTRDSGVWSFQQTLFAAGPGDFMGFDVAVHGDLIAAGAYTDDDFGANSGAVYVFERTAGVWTEEDKITPDDVAGISQFGRDVDLDGATLVVGEEFRDAAFSNDGAVFVFERTTPSGVPTWTNTAFLTVSEAANDDRLGADVAISGDTIIAGATNHDVGGLFNSGAAYLFTRDDQGAWAEAGRLEIPDPESADLLGGAVAIDGDTAIAGATGRDNPGGAADQGTAIVFSRLGEHWIPPNKRLDTSPLADGDEAGFSVAIDGEWAVVGIPGFDNAGDPDEGAVRIYRRDGSRWIETQQILNPNNVAGARFGASVAIDFPYIVAGAPDISNGQGIAYAFTFNAGTDQWEQDSPLFNPSPNNDDHFGAAVDVRVTGETRVAIVGAPDNDNVLTDDGAAYVFRRTGGGWSFEAELFSIGAADGGNFGEGVTIQADQAVVGAPDETPALPGTSGGRAHLYRRFADGGQWAGARIIDQPGDDDVFDFGADVHLEGETLLVGAPGYIDGPTSNSGAAYVYRVVDSVFTLQATLVPDDGFGGNRAGARVALDGDLALLGTVVADGAGIADAGAAWLFQRTDAGWIQRDTLLDVDVEEFDFFGYDVALSNGIALIGVPFETIGADATGAAVILPVHDAALEPLAVNRTQATTFTSLADALVAAQPFDAIRGSAQAFWGLASTSFLGRPLFLDAVSELDQPRHNAITLADQAALASSVGAGLTLYGATTLPSSANATIDAHAFRLGAHADLNLFSNASLNLIASESQLAGGVNAFPGASIAASGPIAVSGDLALPAGALSAPALTIDHGGRFVGSGDLFANVTNHQSFICIANTIIAGNLTNADNATLTVQIGTLTLLGSLTNDGTIVGDLQTLLGPSQLRDPDRTVTQPGDGLSIAGSYTAGASASLNMPDPVWRLTVTRDYDVAINDSTRYDMAQAELRLASQAPTLLEVMSLDIGADLAGLDRTLPGHYPVGTLRLAGNTTTLADTHDNANDGQASCEAIYVSQLIIEPGATLNTLGCRIYYETLVNDGTVDDPANLIELVPSSDCIGDIDGDGDTDVFDFAELAVNFGAGPGATLEQGDITGDGFVDVFDFANLAADFGCGS